MNTSPHTSARLFYCHAHEDGEYRLELEKHLASFKRKGYLVDWSDSQIAPGQDRQQAVAGHLCEADVIVLLISPDFIYSDRCHNEMQQAHSLQKEGRTRLVPVLLRPVSLQQTELADLPLLPENGRAIRLWEHRDEAWYQVASRIGQIVSELLALPMLVPEIPLAIPVSPPMLRSHLPEPRNPFKGLRAFTSRDEQDFFGRANDIQMLLQKVQMLVSGASQIPVRLLTVIGASGSGKSSLVLAGLLPALKRGALPGSTSWIYLNPMTPGLRPIEELTRILAPAFPQRSLASLQEDLQAPSKRGFYLLLELLLQKEAPAPVVFFLDQFEELFTQTQAEAERVQFIELLSTALREPGSHLLLILTLRADFYQRPMDFFPDFFRLMTATQVHIFAPEYRDLRDSIRKPAVLPDVQLHFEDDLVGEILADVLGQSGVLPLLQFTLDRLFQKRAGHLLTLSAYHEMGGVQGALIQHAEAIYALVPDQEQRDLVRALFLQLVEPAGLDQDPARRRVILSELVLPDARKAAFLAHIVALFTTARLLTATKQGSMATLEVSHEALISTWPRLAEWLRESYEALYMHRRLREDAAMWQKQGRPVSDMYDHRQLVAVQRWRNHTLLTCEEEAFLSASQQQVQQRSLARRRAGRRRVLIGATAALIFAAGGSALMWKVFLSAPASSSPAPVSVFPTALPPFILKAYAGAVTSVHWSPDGRWLATSSAESTVSIWDFASGQSVRTLTGHTQEVKSVHWSPNGRLLASAGGEGTARIWDAGTGRVLHILIHPVILDVQWSPNNRLLATAGSDALARVWDATTGKLLHILKGHTDNIGSVQWSPDSQRLVTASQDASVRIWNISNGQSFTLFTDFVSNVYAGPVNSVQWFSSGRWLASGTQSGIVAIWDMATGRLFQLLQGHTGGISALAWSPDGHLLATAAQDFTARIWEVETGQSLHVLRGHTYNVIDVQWSSDGHLLATASWDETARVWDVETGQALFLFHGHIAALNNVAWSPDGQWLATASNDATARVWDTFSAPLFVYKGQTDDIRSVQWSPDSQRLATAGDDYTAQIWSVPTGQTMHILQGHVAIVMDVQWSPDHLLLATAGQDRTARIWDTTTGQSLHILRGHTNGVNHVRWSPDSRWLATSSWDNTARIWDTATGQALHILRGHLDALNALAWSPDGKWLATASNDATARVWDMTSGQTVHILRGHSGIVQWIIWSPDGKWLASAGNDETARIWDAASGQLLHILKGHTGGINTVQWSPDGKWLASASNDHTGRIWDTTRGSPLHVLNGHTNIVWESVWSPDGKWLATASADATAGLWLWTGSSNR